MKQVWIPWTEWECYPAGMFDGKTELSPDDAKIAYAEFLRSTTRFKAALVRVMTEWPKSCLHFLSNDKINRIAWLGQASMCIATGINYTHRSGFKLLSEDEQREANETAGIALKQWLNEHESAGVHQYVEASRVSAGHTRRGSGRADDGGTCAFIQGDLFGDTAQ